jgi:hypothetical protein
MTTNVSVLTKVVNGERDDRGYHYGHTPLVTLLDRLQSILDERGWSQRELSREAKLDDRHVGVIMGRLRKNPDAKLEHDTVAAIAKAGRVRLEWLSTGEEPRELRAATGELTIERPDRYPNRAVVIETYRNEVSPKAIERLRNEYVAFHGPDPSRKEWTDWLFAIDGQVRREEKMTPAPAEEPEKPKRRS